MERKRKKEIENEIQAIDSFEPIEFKEEEVFSIKKDKSNKVDILRNGFDSDREIWSDKIDEYSDYFRDLKKLIDLQLNVYSDRQKLCENKSKIIATKIKYDKLIRDKRKTLFYKAKTESDVILKYNNEITIYIESELKNELEILELLNMHILFLEETLKNIDNVIYGIKTRIEIETSLNR